MDRPLQSRGSRRRRIHESLPASRSVMKRLFAALPLLLAACDKPQAPTTAASEAKAAPALTDWPVTRGGPQLQGKVAVKLFRSPAIEWTHDLGSPCVAEAAVAEGAIVVGDVMG